VVQHVVLACRACGSVTTVAEVEEGRSAHLIGNTFVRQRCGTEGPIPDGTYVFNPFGDKPAYRSES
jgi:hypothetical protein